MTGTSAGKRCIHLLLQEVENFILKRSFMELQVAAQLSCPSCSNSGQNTLLWNLWTTLETGQWSLKTDSGPKVIVSHPPRPLHPPSPSHTQLFHMRNMTTGCRKRARLPRSGQCGRTVGNPRTGRSGSDEEQLNG